MNVSVIIPAAGLSARFGSFNKLNQEVGGRPLLMRTVELFTKRQEVGSIIVAGPPDSFDEFKGKYGASLGFHGATVVPGGRLVCVVGDVCLSRRNNNGRHVVVPLHASIQEHCRHIGFDNLASIIWHKIANATYEVQGAGGFLGKPYEPNAVIKNDIEFILMERKPGGYRKPSSAKRILSVISVKDHQRWFQQIWTGLTGASTKHHPAPYPIEIAHRLIRMFSFVGDTVLDPFHGTGSTSVAAARSGRNSIGVETDAVYFERSCRRFAEETSSMFSHRTLNVLRDDEAKQEIS